MLIYKYAELSYTIYSNTESNGNYSRQNRLGKNIKSQNIR